MKTAALIATADATTTTARSPGEPRTIGFDEGAGAGHRGRDLERLAECPDVLGREEIGHDRGHRGVLDGRDEAGPVVGATQRAAPVQPEPGGLVAATRPGPEQLIAGPRRRLRELLATIGGVRRVDGPLEERRPLVGIRLRERHHREVVDAEPAQLREEPLEAVDGRSVVGIAHGRRSYRDAAARRPTQNISRMRIRGRRSLWAAVSTIRWNPAFSNIGVTPDVAEPDVDAAAFGVDRVGLDAGRAGAAGEVDDAVEQRRGDTLPAVADADVEAEDRPDRQVVDLRDRLRVLEPGQPRPRPEPAPAGDLAVDVGEHPGRRLLLELFTQCFAPHARLALAVTDRPATRRLAPAALVAVAAEDRDDVVPAGGRRRARLR